MQTNLVTRTATVRPNLETTAWKWMRYSAFLLIPLAWGHVILQDVIVGVHKISLDYVQQRWANLGWRSYTAFLLIFAFAHGMNGLRQVMGDFFPSPGARQWTSRLLLAVWLVVSLMGGVALMWGGKS
jgi:succinate dehydrogenase / fumarate reductase, membrane anchor subunit